MGFIAGVIADFMRAIEVDVEFSIAWKRARHIRYGHPYNSSKLLDSLHSEKHPHTNEEYIYTVNIMKCMDCGLSYNDCGVERRSV